MFDKLTLILAAISGRRDLVVGILVLVAVVMMIIPLPTPLVDVLIASTFCSPRSTSGGRSSSHPCRRSS
jgi:type III secretory pathway component EscV